MSYDRYDLQADAGVVFLIFLTGFFLALGGFGAWVVIQAAVWLL